MGLFSEFYGVYVKSLIDCGFNDPKVISQGRKLYLRGHSFFIFYITVYRHKQPIHNASIYWKFKWMSSQGDKVE